MITRFRPSISCVSWLLVGLCACASTRADTTIPGDTPTAEIVEENETPTALVWPDEEFRNKRPKASKPPKLEVPKINTFTLPNGIDVYLVERHQLPVVAMTFTFEIGSIDDPRGKEGLASLAMDLMDEGTAKLDKIQWEARQSDLASSIGSYGGGEESGINIRTLKRNFEPTLDLFVELLETPGMRQSDLERLVDQRKAGLEQARGAPGSITGRVFPAVVFGKNHPYGRITSEKSYDRIKLSDCKSYVRKLRPQGARLFVHGDLTDDEIRKALESRLGKWKGRAPKARKVEPRKPPKGTIFLVDVPGSSQSYISIGHTGPLRSAKDYDATVLMSAILGGSFSSRMNMNLREDKGYSYGARAGFRYLRQGGYLSASAKVQTDATGESLREMLKEIETMRTTDASDEEIGREKEGRIRRFPSRFSTASSTLATFSELVRYGLALDYYEGYRERIEALKIGDVRQSAQAHLPTADYKVLVVGDGKKVQGELEAIAKEGLFGTQGLVLLDADGKRQ